MLVTDRAKFTNTEGAVLYSVRHAVKNDNKRFLEFHNRLKRGSEERWMSSKSAILRRLMSVALVLALTVALLPVAPPAAGAAELSAGNQFLAPIGAPDPNAIKIYTAQQLSDIRNDLSGSYVLMNDIDLSGFNGGEWIPIGSSSPDDYTGRRDVQVQVNGFAGTFDGQGHVIRNLRITGSAYTYAGLFGFAFDATIKNTGMVDTKIDVRSDESVRAGGIVGCYSSESKLTVENCYNTGSVSASSSFSSPYDYAAVAGGILGSSQSRLTVENCYNTGAVSSYSSLSSTAAGGIVGYSDSLLTVKNSYNAGAVSSSSSSTPHYVAAGGIVGRSYELKIESCYNTGDVSSYSPLTASDSAGGIVGYSSSSSGPPSTLVIKDSYNTGDISAVYYAGGIVGYYYFRYDSTSYYAYPSTLTIENCYNTGDVASSADYVAAAAGGIVGFSDSNADASSPSPTLTINNCYCVNSVSKPVGFRSGSGLLQPTITNARVLTAGEMRQQSSFEGFDFDTVWIMDELPRLRSRFAPGSATPALSAVPAASTASGSGAGSAVRLTIGDKKMIVGEQTVTMDVAPYIENNYTMVPVSYVAKALGLASDGVTWDGAARTVTIKTGDRTAVLTIGSAEFSLNGAVVSIPTAPALRDNRAFLPFRVLGEQVLGVKVGWDNAARTATLGG
jgi:hypothetical protein